jgi:hypothetical protein
MGELKTLLTVFILLTLIVSPALASNNVYGHQNKGHGHPQVHVHISRDRKSGTTTVANVYTYNWAGYSINSSDGSVTDVKGSWIVPTVMTKEPNQYSSFWTGMDGENSDTVEQIGTSSDTAEDGSPDYYAWFEFYPEPGYLVPIEIHPGDVISAEVGYAKNQITATVTDVTTKKSFTTTHESAGYVRNSAEWIAEAPWCNSILPLTNFGIASFGEDYTPVAKNCYATIKGQTKDLKSFVTAKDCTVNNIVMVSESSTTDNMIIKAQPAALSKDGTSFQVAWQNAI